MIVNSPLNTQLGHLSSYPIIIYNDDVLIFPELSDLKFKSCKKKKFNKVLYPQGQKKKKNNLMQMNKTETQN